MVRASAILIPFVDISFQCVHILLEIMESSLQSAYPIMNGVLFADGQLDDLWP